MKFSVLLITFFIVINGCNSRHANNKRQMELNTNKIQQNDRTIKIEEYRLNEKPGVVGSEERANLERSIDSLKIVTDSLQKENEKLDKG